ncbi:interleukin-17B-like isoform X2 [Ptychodera flava]
MTHLTLFSAILCAAFLNTYVSAGVLQNIAPNEDASEVSLSLDQQTDEDVFAALGLNMNDDGEDIVDSTGVTDSNLKKRNSNTIDLSCIEPPEQHLQQQLMKKEKSYPNSPMFTVYPFEESESSRNSIAAMDNPYPAKKPNFTCPFELGDQLYADINDRSLCPWTFTLDNDPDRFPKVMAVAACRCTDGCIDTRTGRGSLDNHCKPVTYRVRVLRRQPGCVNGYYRYRFAWESVPVACVCVRDRVYRGPDKLT